MGVEDINNQLENVAIWSWNKSVVVEAPQDFNGNVDIYDILGKHIVSAVIHEGRNEIEIAGSEGFYIINLMNQEGLITEKVFIQ